MRISIRQMRLAHLGALMAGLLLPVVAATSGRAAEEPASPNLPSGDAVIRAPAAGSEIVITTTSRLAGAIHSLTWNGREFIDSADHGRQLQSASNFDAGTRFTPETFNPTEAGSVRDGAGAKSSSRLLHLIARENLLQTTTQMAFWLPPGGTSQGQPAKNSAILSDHLLTKRVQIGFRQSPNVIQYVVTFSVPLGEKHTLAQFESLTGYMPPLFEVFWKFNPKTHELEPLDDGPGEQAFPVILATANGSHAMGILARDPEPPGLADPGYGRFRFDKEKVVKWNCVYRLRDENQGIPPGEYTFHHFVIVGDLEIVKKAMRELHD
jgi:hypothetical protein